jgi:biotin transport system substrate-specific component
MGAAGLPVFAGAKALTAVLPTAGYLVGFVVAGFVVGALAARGFSTTPIRVAASFAIGSAIIYVLGAGWLVVGLGLTLPQALAAVAKPPREAAASTEIETPSSDLTARASPTTNTATKPKKP